MLNLLFLRLIWIFLFAPIAYVVLTATGLYEGTGIQFVLGQIQVFSAYDNIGGPQLGKYKEGFAPYVVIFITFVLYLWMLKSLGVWENPFKEDEN